MAEMDDDQGVNYENQGQMMAEQEKLEAEFKKSGWAMYARPPFQQKQGGKLQFMQIECDYYTVNNESIIRMFGVTAEGNSLLVNVKKFLSYFYIQAPLNLSLTDSSIAEFTNKFNEVLGWQKQFAGIHPIAKIELCEKENLRFYKGENKKIAYLKVYTFQPNSVAQIRNYVKTGDRTVDELQLSHLTFESNIPYALRFMVEYDIVGMGWIEVDNYTIIENKISCCQIEINVDCKDIRAISLDEQSDIAPLRIFSFDIECGAQRGFPQDTQDPIIQIACIVKNHNSNQEIVKVVFALLETEEFPGVRVRSFDNEEDLLMDFQLFLQQLDPDIIIGYNSQNFDLPYLLGRARQLKLQNSFGKFGRISSKFSEIKHGKFMSKAMGMRDTKEINIEGRIQLDMMVHMMRDHKLSSFSLNNVSFQYLKQQKEDVHHSIIYTLWQKTPETRKRLAIYCLKDAQLPILLMEKLCCIYNYSEMARVTGVPINYLFMRGQQIKVTSQILRKSKNFGYIMPTETSNNSDAKYEGAFVITPLKAFYKLPIATLDFASLYPSIMMAHNMCYCTLLKDSWQKVGLTDDSDFTQTPETNVSFVKSHIRKGVLPMILEDLINARKKAKLQLAQEKDPFKKAVLDGRQLALKISANSVYGFTGAQIGQLPCLEISSAITSFGRQMIKLTQELVQQTYSKANGKEHDAEVIYGDTDSVMVKFGVQSVREAMILGKEAAALITKNFISPIKLEFEKVYCPYLLMNSKKYAGLLYTNPDKYDKIDTKGIESVRRDNCFFIRKMVTQIMEYLLIQQDEKKAVQYVQEQIRNLFTNRIDISELVITKSLNKKTDKKDKDNEKYKQKKAEKTIAQTYKQKQAHVILAEKMQKRDETGGPASGDRIAYIMIQGTKGSKNYDNAEDPIEVLLKDFPIDYDYYLEKQIKKPLERIFEHIVPNISVIFQGEHTNVRYVPKLSVHSALGKFVQKKTACLKCKSVVKDNEALCFNCKDNLLELLCKQAFDLSELQFKFHQYGSTCQGCQGSLHQDILCSNRDCEIYYKRVKVFRDLTDKWEEYDKLQAQQW